jgi:hypothetical protein
MIELYICNAILIAKFNTIIMQKEEKSRGIVRYKGGIKLEFLYRRGPISDSVALQTKLE